ncbi:MAG: hypothetical protein BWX67_02354 [Thermotogae bacterium ADurb.Bin062]|nr:MAG: hypothetical protein BWX67_02354 [Thermotogota bacterium ADurb.Bin062]
MNDSEEKKPASNGVVSGASLGASDAKLTANLMLKAEMFDYLCWLEDFCVFREAALDGKAGDYLVTASDGTTCWGKTYAEAVRVAMEHDKELHDATSPNTPVTDAEPPTPANTRAQGPRSV